MQKVVVLGASGMLGSMVLNYLSLDRTLDMRATVRSNDMQQRIMEQLPGVKCSLLDAERFAQDAVQDVLGDTDWAVNAIGVIKPYLHDDNAQEVERGVRVNALFPHLLARAAESTGCKVLQIATDCVYSGRKGNYAENDEHDPLDVYGKSKSLGEVYSPKVHHMRCSIIGPEPKAPASLLEWFLGQARNSSVNGFTNHHWNGVTTLHFAKLCHGIILKGIDLPHAVHIVPSGMVSKRHLLESFAGSYQREDVTIVPAEAKVAIDRTLSTSNESLNKTIWAACGYDEPPTVPEMVAGLAGFKYRFARNAGGV